MKKLFSTSLLILAGMLLLLGSCKEDELPVSGEGNVANNELPVRLAETDYNPDNTYYLLNDNESQDVYFDSGQRSFYVSRPLQFGMDDEHCFQLRFYSPRALKNVTFWARIDGYEEEFKFMSLEKIMPFQQLRVHIPFATKDLTAYTRSGKKIRIMANPYLTEENLTFTVECDDPYWARLQSIRCKWYIAFGRYSDTQDSWKYKMKASHTREAVAIALNMAYMFSSERFKTALYEFGPLHSNNDKTEIDKTALLANVLNHRGLTFGYTTGVMGLGGGTTFGMHEVCYLEHYADDKSITETIFHEFAHCVGYGHAGNMTYEQTGPGGSPCATTYMWRCRWTRSCPSIPAASCTPAGAGTVILMIYTWLRNTLSKTRNSMRWTAACLPCAERPTGEETTGSRWRSSWIIPTCPALREPPSAPRMYMCTEIPCMP